MLAFLLPWLLAWAPLARPLPPSLQGPDGSLSLGTQGVVLQRRPTDCGLAVVAMLAASHGRSLDQSELAVRAGDRLGPAGLRLHDVAALAAEVGVRGRWLRAGLSDLPALPRPFAAELVPPAPAAPGHLVVVRRLSERAVLLADPARGLRGLALDDFRAAWTGLVFVPEAG